MTAAGDADLDEMKARIRQPLENDPGDVLYQWTSPEEWAAGLAASNSVPELFDFLTNRIFGDDCDDSNEDGVSLARD